MKPLVRASSMDRQLSCPGSRRVLDAVSHRVGEGDNWEGNAIHHAIAERLIKELGAIPPEGGLVAPEVAEGYRIPASSAWMVDWCVEHVRQTIPQDWSLLVEVEMRAEFDGWILPGHADVIAISPDGTRMKGKDWKSVHVPVDPAEENEQVLSYLVLSKLEWPSLTEAEFEIVQPRVPEDEGRLSSVTLAGHDLDRAPAVLDARVTASLNDATLCTGIKQCRRCVGLACPAIRQLMKMMLTPEVAASLRNPDDATLGEFVVNGTILEPLIKDAKDRLHTRLDAAGVVVAGDVTISRKVQRGSYTVERPDEFLKAFRSLLPKDESLARCFEPSVTRIKDELAAEMAIPKTGKSAITADGVFQAQLASHVKQGERRVLVFSR